MIMKFKKGDIVVTNGRGELRKGIVFIVSSIKNVSWNPENISVRHYNIKTKKYEIFSYIYNQDCFDMYYKELPIYTFLLRK